MKRRSRILIWIVVLCGVAAGGFFAWDRLARPWVKRWEVGRLMARYAASPDQATADRLVDLLVCREVDAATGDRILELLVTPRIVTRAAYRSDREVMIATEYPCVIQDYQGADARYDVWAWIGPNPPADLKLKLTDWEKVLAGGGPVEQTRMVGPLELDGGAFSVPGSVNAFMWGIRGQTYALNNAHGETEPLPVGAHEATVLVACDVRCPTVQRRWQWPSSGGFPRKWIPSRVETVTPPPKGWIAPSEYYCQVKLPVTIRVAEPGGEEKIVLRTGPELDAAVKKAVKVSVRPFSPPSGGLVGPSNGIGIDVASAPETLFFRNAFRPDPGGHRQDQPETRLANGAGVSAMGWNMTATRGNTRLEANQVFWFKGAGSEYTMSASYFDLDRPGVYRGHIVLTPDPDAAWPDPRIKTLYGGTVELPIALIVDANGDVSPLDDPLPATAPGPATP